MYKQQLHFTKLSHGRKQLKSEFLHHLILFKNDFSTRFCLSANAQWQAVYHWLSREVFPSHTPGLFPPLPRRVSGTGYSMGKSPHGAKVSRSASQINRIKIPNLMRYSSAFIHLFRRGIIKQNYVFHWLLGDVLRNPSIYYRLINASLILNIKLISNTKCVL